MKGVTIITDLHWRDKNTKTQPNLIKRQDELLDKIYKLIEESRHKYTEYYVVFAGDVIHTGLTGLEQTKFAMFMSDISLLCTEVYFTIGNHELTYKSKNNIFWNMCHGELIQISDKHPLIRPVFRCDNSFVVDNVMIKLWHYGQVLKKMDLTEYNDLVIIGHNNVFFPGMKEVYSTLSVDLLDRFVKYQNFSSLDTNFDKLRYIFLGHMHSLVGKFKLSYDSGECIVQHLGSLGRTKSPEYEITNSRSIPTMEIDGDLINVVDTIIELSDSEDLDDEEVLLQQEKYRRGKYIKEIRQNSYSSVNILNEVKELYYADRQKTNLLSIALGERNDTEVERVISYLENVDIYEG